LLQADILGFMLPGDPEEGFSADPPIQRWTCVEISYGRLIQKSSIPAANHVIK